MAPALVKVLSAAGQLAEFTVTVSKPVMLPVTVSVATMVCDPGVLKVTPKPFVPLTSVESAGFTAAPSELVKCTVPAYPVAVLLNWSCAVTVKFVFCPAVAVAGAVTR